MNRTEQTAEAQSTRTGILAVLAHLFRGQRSGAPSHRRPTHARPTGRAFALSLAVGCLAVAMALLPAGAQAAQDHAFSTTIGTPGPGAGQLSLQPFRSFEAAGSGVAVSPTGPTAGDLYVADSGNHRIDVFTPGGAFVSAFGWEVDSGAPEAKLQTCTTLTGCQAGAPGTAPGQLGDPTYLAFDEDPSSPSFGDLYVAAGTEVPGQNERQDLEVKNATGGTFTLSFEGQTTAPIPFDASRGELQEALGALPTIGPDNLFVNSVHVDFAHALGETDVPQLTANSSGLTGAGATVEVSTAFDGSRFAPEIITKFDPEGHLVESWGASGRLAETPPLATGTADIASGSATGEGDLASNSTQISNVGTTSGAFVAGLGIVGRGIPTDTYVTAVGPGTLTLSRPAEETATRSLSTNTRFITNVHATSSGQFEDFQQISGPGIPPGTRIEALGPGYLVLDKDATAGGAGVALAADQPFGETSGIAVGPSSGDLLVADGQLIFRFDQGSGFLGSLTLGAGGGDRLGAAVDPGGDLYRGKAAEIEQYAPAGNRLGSLYLTPETTLGHHRASITAFTRAPSGETFVDEGTQVQDISRRCEASVLGCLSSQEFGAPHLSGAAGLAAAPDGTLYAANTGAGQVAVFTVSLEARVEAPTGVRGTGALLHATIDPEGTPVTTCRFQYGPSTTYGGNLPCLDGSGHEVGTEADPITGTAPVAVHAPLEGLEAGAVYHYRLRARNTATPAEEVHSEDEQLETLVLPRIEATEATELTASTATLKARIDPQGPAVVSCRIEWGPTAEPGNPAVPYGHTVDCEPPSLPAGTGAQPVSAHLEGLSPGTSYHWRVKAEDVDGTQTSPEHTFVFLGPPSTLVPQDCADQALREADRSTALPDCRAYEQVSPPQKNGSTVVGRSALTNLFSVAQDGSRVLAPTLQCFADSTSCTAVRPIPAGDIFQFSRTGAGWQPSHLGASAAEFAGSTLLVAGPDAPDQLLALPVAEPPALAGREWLYARHADSSLTAIGPVFPTAGTGANIVAYGKRVFASADLSHVVYSPESSAVRWPFDQTAPGGASIYEYAGPAPHPFLVAVSGGVESNELIGTCGAQLVASEQGRSLSADGRTVFFAVETCPGGTGTNAGVEVPVETLYARIDGESPDAHTVKLSAPAPAPACDSACQAEPPAVAVFAGSAVDGSDAYFLSTQQLTDEATEDSRSGDHAGDCREARGSGCNLYLYTDLRQEPAPSGDHLVDVSAGDSSGQGPQVQGVMAVSQDGGRVYFVARGLLAGANAEGVEPTEGADNLYLYDAGEARTRFVATLPGVAGSGESEQWDSTVRPTADITPDGRFLLFTSHGALTPDATRGEGPAQVYHYDAQGEKLTRVSIGQKGFDDNGNAGSGDAAIASIEGALLQSGGRPPLDSSISADGTRVFFESPVGLTPAALNDVAVNNRGGLAENVYEWEQDGAGGCAEASGCLYLISDGADAAEGSGVRPSAVTLIGTDATGQNVFFTTADPLVPGDTDTEGDIYDARVGGGFAPPAGVRPCDSGETCHGEGTRPGAERSPATGTFSGPEEGPKGPVRCRKGRVRKHGRCVKRKAARKHHGKKKSHRRTGSNHGGGK